MKLREITDKAYNEAKMRTQQKQFETFGDPWVVKQSYCQVSLNYFERF